MLTYFWNFDDKLHKSNWNDLVIIEYSLLNHLNDLLNEVWFLVGVKLLDCHEDGLNWVLRYLCVWVKNQWDYHGEEFFMLCVFGKIDRDNLFCVLEDKWGNKASF